MKFYINTLGCKVNTYESNVMRDLLQNAGYIETNEQDASIIIINTCTVTNTADHKSLKMIKRAKKMNPQAMIIVVGCLTQTGLEKVKEIEGIAIILGNVGKSNIVKYIEQYQKEPTPIIDIKNIDTAPFEEMKLNNFEHTRAFVKIQDGCNNYCSYCIIPYSRGNVRSKKPEDVLEEICHLVKQGHLEIVLTGIHTGHYGSEFSDYDFADLLEAIVKIPGLKRLRISSIEMNEITDRVLSLMDKHKILVDHMHIPLQSGSDTILNVMNRKYNKQEFISKIQKIRKIRPNISITTDVIVGFPGETEELFLETIETITKIQFSKIHVFPYSVRNGTKAATMDNQIPEEIKKERVRKLLSISKELEIAYMKGQLGKEVTYIPEIQKDEYWIGHTGNYLLVKELTKEEWNHEERTVTVISIEYPYVIVK